MEKAKDLTDSTKSNAPKISSLLDSATTLSPHALEFGEREVTAYIASRFPATYGVLFNVLTEAGRRIPWLKPQRVLDFGTGPGTALW